MYLDCQVEIPNELGKITRFRKGKATYIRYVVGRIYNAEKKYNVPDHKSIDKLVLEDTMMMVCFISKQKARQADRIQQDMGRGQGKRSHE